MHETIKVWHTFEDTFGQINRDRLIADGIFLERFRSPQTKRGTPAPSENSAAEFARARLSFHGDALQMEVLGSTAKRGILNCCRQWGKSTVAGIKAVHHACTVPGSLVVVASPSERQSAEFVQKVKPWLRKLGITPRGDGRNKTSLLFPNGSRMIGLPGNENTLRGLSSVGLMIIDEAARVGDEIYRALRPMLAVANGDLWLLSTPAGRRGFFYENWTAASPEWRRISIPATECPRISAAFLEEERAQMGHAAFRQEYLCEFVDDGVLLFDRDLVRATVQDVATMEFHPRVTPTLRARRLGDKPFL
jgi:hypothetical protein